MSNKKIRITKLDIDTYDLNKYIDEQIAKENPKETPLQKVTKLALCRNPWCKAQFRVNIYPGEPLPKVCNKCKDFDENLSNGVTFTEKKYEGNRNDGNTHEVKIDVNDYNERGSIWKRLFK